MSLAATLQRSKTERESWRYTDLEKLLAAEPLAARAPQLDVELPAHAPHLVFINGVWDRAQSDLQDLPQDILQGDETAGYKIALAGETCLVTSPLYMLFFVTKTGDFGTQLNIEIGRSGRLTLIEQHIGGSGTMVMETNIALAEQAKLVHGKIVKGGTASVHLAMTRAAIAEGAFYDQFTLIKGGKLTRNEIDASLNGKMAQCTLNGAMLLQGRDHADTTTRITHAAPHGTSREIYKSVVAEQARAVFQGKILVKEGAQKTDGHQLSRALLLSDQAEMDAKPELEIYADDVKCSHGSTVGDLDEQALFYLRARGLNEQEARSLLIEAFVGEILDEIHADELRTLCSKEVEGWLHDHK